MSTSTKQVLVDDWRRSYRDALAAVADRSMSERISIAEKAIIRRMRQLQGSSRESAEWRAIASALKALQALKQNKLMFWFGQEIQVWSA